MKLIRSLLPVALASGVFAVSEWGQCGGIGYSGSTDCDAGLTCVHVNDYYFQCQQGTASTTSTTSRTTSTTTATTRTLTTTSAAPAATGYVGVSGTRFTLNGQRFVPVGTNSYWVGLMGFTTNQMNQAFSDIAKTGATVVRTWGFNEVTSPSGIYYQSWSGSTPTINTGSTGLGNFDNVVAAAKANGIRLIVPLTNNWGDYGGMDVYVKQIANSANHDLFYTNTAVIAAYKNYIKTFVGRYVNEPTIMAWELANEPRCGGSTGTTTGTCTTATITSWIQNISSYIQSIDSNHLVAVGDEGFFNQPGNPSYPYQGGEGIDFDANLKISSIDFGTFHLYPISWGQTSDPVGWGNQWITDHATSMKNANKPVIIEEFGVTTNQTATYQSWYSTIVSSGLTGDLIWQAGSSFSTNANDGYMVFPGDANYQLETSHSAALKARST